MAIGRTRRLGAESLESRQLLHGGGMVDPEALAERVAGILERRDADGSGELEEAEVGRAWDRLADADTDNSGGISADELQAKLEAALAERAENEGERQRRPGRRGHRGHRGDGDSGGIVIADRVDRVFGEADSINVEDLAGRKAAKLAEIAGDDGILTRDELTAHLAAIDTDGDGTITRDEARAHREANREDGGEGDGEAPAATEVATSRFVRARMARAQR